MRGDEAWNNYLAGHEGESTWENRAFQGNQSRDAGQDYEDIQSSQKYPWSDEDRCHPSAPSTTRPLNRFLNQSHKREFFWINGETTENAYLEELDQKTFLPKIGRDTSDEFAHSSTIQKSNEASRGMPSRIKRNGTNKASSTNELSTTKRSVRGKILQAPFLSKQSTPHNKDESRERLISDRYDITERSGPTASGNLLSSQNMPITLHFMPEENWKAIEDRNFSYQFNRSDMNYGSEEQPENIRMNVIGCSPLENNQKKA
jgi:hypothetical protein